MKILFLCSGSNSCRSVMAEAILKDMDNSLEVFSAGLHPDAKVDPVAIRVMKEIGIDISTKEPKGYQKFEGMEVDYLITLCEGTKDKIASINISARHKIHLGFEDPRKTNCSEEQIVYVYRNIRDEIKNELEYFFSRILESEPKAV
jgi:arsenate reductase (thioredoxin)